MKIFKLFYKKYSDSIRGLKYKRIIRSLNQKRFSILSSDCLGGILYHDLRKQFSSPTINLFFKEDDYSFLNFCLDPSYYCKQELVFVDSDSYPRAVIYGDKTHQSIFVNFMHYANTKEAKECWKKRCLRLENSRACIYLKFKLDDADFKLISQINNIFVITSNQTEAFFLDSPKIHVSKYLSKIGYNNGKLMSFHGLLGSRNFDDLKILDYLYESFA